MLKQQWLLLVLTLCLAVGASAAPTRTTTIVLINKGRMSSLTVSIYGPLQISAYTSQTGTKRGTTALMGNVIINASRKQGALHLEAERAAVETQLVEVELKAQAMLGYSNVLSTFSTALKNFPSAPKFRTYWMFTAGFGVGQCYYILYNRRLQMLRSYIYYDEEGAMTRSFLYSHVTDTVLQRNYLWCKGSDGGDFSTIPYFGAISRKAHSRYIVGS